MIDVLEDAVRRASALPAAMQEEIAQVVLAFIGADLPVLQLTPAEEAELDAADLEISRGDLASDEEVAAILS